MDGHVCVNVLQDSKWIVDCSFYTEKYSLPSWKHVDTVTARFWHATLYTIGPKKPPSNTEIPARPTLSWIGARGHLSICICNVGYTIQRCNLHQNWRKNILFWLSSPISPFPYLVALFGTRIHLLSHAPDRLDLGMAPSENTASKFSNCASMRSNKFGMRGNEDNGRILASVLNLLITKNGCWKGDRLEKIANLMKTMQNWKHRYYGLLLDVAGYCTLSTCWSIHITLTLNTSMHYPKW